MRLCNALHVEVPSDVVEAAFWERSRHCGDSGEDVSYPVCAWVTHKNVTWARNCIMNSNNGLFHLISLYHGYYNLSNQIC